MAKSALRRFACTFGSGDFGRLVHGSNAPELLPRIVAQLANSNVRQAAAGGAHTVIVTGRRPWSFAFPRDSGLMRMPWNGFPEAAMSWNHVALYAPCRFSGHQIDSCSHSISVSCCMQRTEQCGLAGSTTRGSSDTLQTPSLLRCDSATLHPHVSLTTEQSPRPATLRRSHVTACSNCSPPILQTLQRVDLPDPVMAVTAGHYHTLALTTSGKQLQCLSVLSAVFQHMRQYCCRRCRCRAKCFPESQVTFGHGVVMQLASWGLAGQESPTCARPSEWSRFEVRRRWTSPILCSRTTASVPVQHAVPRCMQRQ